MVKNQKNHRYEDFVDCYYSKRLLQKLLLLNKGVENKLDFDQIKRAIYYAKKYHGGQERKTGELFYSHSLEVAYMVSDYSFNTDVIITAILHNTIEDTELSKEMIAKAFGDNIADQVEDLTRIKQDYKISSTEMIRILYIQQKNDLLLIKLCDRLHNMQTVRAKSLEKMWKTTSETLQVFLALAAYLKIPEIAWQLEKHCWNVISNYKILQNKLLSQTTS